jgi:hypothetical protein
MLSVYFPRNKPFLYYCIGSEQRTRPQFSDRPLDLFSTVKATQRSSRQDICEPTRKATGEAMEKYKFIIIALGLIVGFLVAGCDTASVKKNDIDRKKIIAVRQELKDARIAYLAVWHKFKLETEQEIELNQKKIDVIKDIMVDAGPMAIKKYRIRMYGLQRTNRDLQMTLEHYTNDGRTDRKEESTIIAME